MKLWYQSMTRSSAWPAYNEGLRAVLDGAKEADTVIEVHGIAGRGGGIGDQYRYLEFIETAEVLENVERATAERFDAFLIGNIGDPGLREAREIADMPVLGLCETSVHLATMMGANFALVTGNEKHESRIVGNITSYGLRAGLLGVARMELDRLARLDQGFSDPAAAAALIDRFLVAARTLVEDGAEIIIPAIGVLMVLLARHAVHEVQPGVPILNGVNALVKMGEMAVKLRALLGGNWTSRRCMYATPPAHMLAELRAVYGPVYGRLDAAAGPDESAAPGSPGRGPHNLDP